MIYMITYNTCIVLLMLVALLGVVFAYAYCATTDGKRLPIWAVIILAVAVIACAVFLLSVGA